MMVLKPMNQVLKMIIYSHHRMPLLYGIKDIIFRKGQNFVLLIIGKPQTGKSIATMILCYEWAYGMGLDPTFSLKNRVSMGDAKDFIEKTNLNLKRGMILVMEEGGKGMDSQLWYDQLQKDLKHIMHTFGHEGLFIIINAITKDINSKIMPLVRGELEMKDLDKSRGISVGTFRTPVYDQVKKKVVRQKLPRMVYPDGSSRIIKNWYFKKPKNTNMIDNYMSWSVPEKIKLKEDKLKEINIREEKRKKIKKRLSAQEIKDIIIQKPEEYKKVWHNKTYWNRNKIMGVYDCGHHTLNKVLGLLGDP